MVKGHIKQEFKNLRPTVVHIKQEHSIETIKLEASRAEKKCRMYFFEKLTFDLMLGSNQNLSSDSGPGCGTIVKTNTVTC